MTFGELLRISVSASTTLAICFVIVPVVEVIRKHEVISKHLTNNLAPDQMYCAQYTSQFILLPVDLATHQVYCVQYTSIRCTARSTPHDLFV